MELISEKEFRQKLLNTCSDGDFPQTKKLIQEFNQLNSGVENPSRVLFDGAFFAALNYKHFEIASYIIERGLDHWILEDAIYNEVYATSELLDWGIQGPIQEDPTPELNFLISKGSNINFLDQKGRTPLDLAVLFNYPKAAEILLKAGAKRGSELMRETTSE